MVNSTPFGELKEKFKAHNIFFRFRTDEPRHKDTDLIRYESGRIIEPYTAFVEGSNVFTMGSFSYSCTAGLPVNTEVGRYCSIAGGLKVLGVRHPYEWLTTSSSTYDRFSLFFKQYCLDNNIEAKYYRRPTNESISGRKDGIIIDHDVWIGANVVLKSNIHIGTGAVIAANAVVTKDVPPYAIVGGNPAKLIKYRFNNVQIERLLESQWWRYAFPDIQQLDITDIERFLSEFGDKQHELAAFEPKPLIL
ncbi:hypothetical protein OA57_08775 [Chelonobacter oris]|uniref:Acetyltransferase n=1 Tax=Chelonobacter oris TaxID=505317 RepID=A0A0A3AK99_9PAST|nr:CatB-related O-acetyltransferase [Chelonobacter oris]KGQ69731.1 hypothetical protein OA57_08775 [Chelonobacter oris]